MTPRPSPPYGVDGEHALTGAPGRIRARPAWRRRAAVAFALALGLAALPALAQAIDLVGNTGQTAHAVAEALGPSSTAVFKYALSFTTGPHSPGYTFDSVRLFVGDFETGETLVVRLLNDNSNAPGTLRYTLTNPTSLALNVPLAAEFSAPSGATLLPDRKYWVEVEVVSGLVHVGTTSSDGEDSGVLTVWSIGNETWWRSMLYMDDSYSSSNTNTKVFRMAVKGTPRGSNDAALSALRVFADGTALSLDSPSFASDVTTYYLPVANSVDVLTVRPTPRHGDANFTFLDASDNASTDASTDSGHQVNLSVGANTIKVKVAAVDFITTRTYTLHVARAPRAPTGTCGDDVIWCANLKVGTHTNTLGNGYCLDCAAVRDGNYGSLSDTSFERDGTTYTVQSIRWGTGTKSNLHLDLDGLTQSSDYDTWILHVGADSWEVSGGSISDLRQISFQDAYESLTRPALNATVTVKLTLSPSDATLSALAVSDGTTALAFDHPSFPSPETTYFLSVANSVNVLSVAPTTNDSGASVAYFDGSGNAITDLTSATDPLDASLSVGTNVIQVKVTAEDTTTTETYTIHVGRAALAPTGTCAAIWCANLTLGEAGGDAFGYSSKPSHEVRGGLAPKTFTIESRVYTVEVIFYDRDNGEVRLDFNRNLPAGDYVLGIGGESFAFAADGSTKGFSACGPGAAPELHLRRGAGGEALRHERPRIPQRRSAGGGHARACGLQQGPRPREQPPAAGERVRRHGGRVRNRG